MTRAALQLETDHLALLVTQKRACLAELREMGEVQLRLIREGSMTALLDVLAAKQRALSLLQSIDKSLMPYRAEDPMGRRWRSAATRETCARELAACESLLGEIVAQEKQSEAELVRQRDATAGELRLANSAGAARGAYRQQAAAPVNYLDLSSEC